MKTEKFFLFFLGVIFSLLFSVSSTAENLSSLEAIWDSAELNQLDQKKASPKKSQRQINAERQKLKITREKLKREALQKQRAKQIAQQKHKQKPAAKKLTQQANNKFAEAELARKRKIWKAKWDAQQHAKKQQLARAASRNKTAPVIAKTPKVPVQNNEKITAAELALLNPQAKVKRSTQVAPKPLTREQYQWRWKQAQLKKQQLAQAKRPQVKTNSFSNKHVQKYAVKTLKPRQTHAPFRSNPQPAIIKTLPYGVRSKLNAAKLNSYGMSAYVTAVNSPRPLLGHQEQTSRVPASVMKLITSYAALGTLGPNYRWPFDVMTNGVIRNGTLQGD